MKISKTAAALVLSAIMTAAAAAPVSAENLIFTDCVPKKAVHQDIDTDREGLISADGYMLKITDGKIDLYTGFAKTSKGVFCYLDGVKWQGWYKSGDKWYYFDPENGGARASGKAKTPLGYYYLDENGAWNGKMSKAAKCPEDFRFTLSAYGYSYEYYLNTADGIIRRDNYMSDDIETEKSVKISPRDLQIICDELTASGMTDPALYNYHYHGEDIAKALGVKDYASCTDMTNYYLTWRTDNTDYSLSADQSMYDFYSESAEVQKLAHLLSFTEMYMQSFPEYREIVSDEEKYIEKHRYEDISLEDMVPAEGTKTYIYRLKGCLGTYSQTVIIDSREDMNELTAKLKQSGLSDESQIIKRLSGYTDDYFKENAVIFSGYNAPTSSVKFEGADIYAAYSNAYLSVNVSVPEIFNEEELYCAFVSEISISDLGYDKENSRAYLRINVQYD